MERDGDLEASASAAVLERFADAVSRADADSDVEVDGFYDRLAEAVCELGPMRGAVIARYDEALQCIDPVGAHRLDLGGGIAGAQPLVPLVRRVLEEDRVLEIRQDAEALVCTPMAAAGRNVGVIFAEREADSDPLCQRERERLSMLGKTAALAALAWIATTRRERVRRVTERVELTRELHEHVAQRLFGVSLALSGSDALGGASRQRCTEEIQAALLDLRAILRRALPGSPVDTDTTLRELVRGLARAHPRLRLEVEWPAEVAVPAALEPALQSILAELVRNVHKHASPSRTVLRIAVADAMLELVLTNDGARERGSPLGAGLQLAAYDALRVGGTLAAGPHDGDTWRARLLVPVGEAA